MTQGPGPCKAACEGRVCGPDGCGGSCGSCFKPFQCDLEVGQCYDPDNCSPKCEGKQCGPDYCGGTCGACAAGVECNAQGTCGDAPGPGDGTDATDGDAPDGIVDGTTEPADGDADGTDAADATDGTEPSDADGGTDGSDQVVPPECPEGTVATYGECVAIPEITTGGNGKGSAASGCAGAGRSSTSPAVAVGLLALLGLLRRRRA